MKFRLLFTSIFTLLLLLAGANFKTHRVAAKGSNLDGENSKPTAVNLSFKEVPLEDIPKDTLITLERTLCYGFCPSYKLTIAADGSVVFEGREHVKKTGISKSQISQEAVRQLISEFEKANYFSLKNQYKNPEDGCDGWVTDNPSAITAIRINGKTKTVDHYYGCRGAKVLEALTRLETRIDEMANTAQWIK
jgi:hypothetical protein